MKTLNSFTFRVVGKTAFGIAAVACALWGLAEPPAASAPATRAMVELPAQWQGQPVRPLALSAVERRFAERFPGHIARLTDGRQIVVLRDVAVPTRMLHPAADCYRALGYRIEGERLERVPMVARSPALQAASLAEGALTPSGIRAASNTASAAPVQRCFTARKDGVALRVCEQIEDAHGQRFADTSAWYWAAALGQSQGPWRAVTVTQPLTEQSEQKVAVALM